MRRKRSPPPSKSAERVLEYLEMVRSAQEKNGFAKKYDFLKKTMNETQASRMISYFIDNSLIKEEQGKGFFLTKNGEDLLEILRKRNLVGLLTRELSSDRIRRW